MGGYCKFCNTRCFVPTNNSDYVTKDLKATCEKGIIFDMNKTLKKLMKSDDTTQVGWLISLNRGEKYSTCLEFIKGELLEYEVNNNSLEEIIDLTANKGNNIYYRLK